MLIHFKLKQEFEEPTDPFQNHRRRFKNEMDRYLNNVNLNFLPPMPKPNVPIRSQSKSMLNSETNTRTMPESQSNMMTSNNYSSNYQKSTDDNNNDEQLLQRSDEFD